MQGEKKIASLVPAYIEVVGAYLEEELKSRNLTSRTRKNMEQAIVECLLFLQSELFVKHPKRIEAKHIEAFLETLERRGHAAAARRKRQELKDFFAWLQKEKHIPYNPVKSILPVKQETDNLRVLTVEEYQRLIDAIDDVQDKALIQMLVRTDITLLEIHHLNLDDVRLPIVASFSETGADWIRGTGRLRARGRNKKCRLIQLDEDVYEAALAWAIGRLSLTIRLVVEDFLLTPLSNNAFFLSQKGTRLSPKRIQHIVEKWIKKAGLEGVSVKTLRNTCAIHHLAKCQHYLCRGR